MNSFGRIFRDLRIQKNYSLKDVSNGILSPSFLSKFERGETDISLRNFYALLERLNISLSEFTFIANNYEISEYEKLLSAVKTAYENNNISYLLYLSTLEMKKWEQSAIEHYKLNSIMIQALLSNLDENRHLDQKEVEYLSDYLIRSEIWGYYEITLFRNSMSTLSITTIITLSKELIKKMQIFKKVDKYYNELIRTLLNTIIVCLECEKFNDSLLFIKTLENLLQNTDKFYEKTELLFVKGIYDIQNGRKREGVLEIKKALSIMENLEAFDLASNHEKYLDKFMNL